MGEEVRRENSGFHLQNAQLSRFLAAWSANHSQNGCLDSCCADELDAGAVDWDRQVAHPVVTINRMRQGNRRNGAFVLCCLNQRSKPNVRATKPPSINGPRTAMGSLNSNGCCIPRQRNT